MTINNEEKLQQAFDFTKIFRKTFKISFIEFLINSIVGYIFKGKCRTKSRFYYLKLFILVETFVLLTTIFSTPSVSYKSYIIFIGIQFIILIMMVLFVYVFNISSSYSYLVFSVDTYDDKSINKEKLYISMIRLIFQVSFLSSNLIERNESGEFVLKKSKLKAVENFMIDLQSVFNSDSYYMHKFNDLFKKSIKNKLIYQNTNEDKNSELLEITNFIITNFIDNNSIIDIINYCIYSEIIYLNFGNMLIKYYPKYITDEIKIHDYYEMEKYCKLDFSDEIHQSNISDNTNDILYFERTAFGNFVSLYSNKFYKKYKSIRSLMIRWISSYDYYIFNFYTYEDILNKNICINIPYEKLDENDIIDKNLIAKVEKRRRRLNFNKKIYKYRKLKQQMNNTNWYEDLIIEDFLN